MLVVRDNRILMRFETASGNATAFVEYRRTGDQIVLSAGSSGVQMLRRPTTAW